VNIRLRSKLSDIFGKAGMEILNGLMAGKTVEAILEHAESKQLKSRVEEIKSVAKGALSENDIFVLKKLTETIEHLNGQIRDVEARIELIANQRTLRSCLRCLVLGSVLLQLSWLRSEMLGGLVMGSRLLLGLGWCLLFISQLVFAFWVLLRSGVLSG